MYERLSHLLTGVKKPARYVGGEWGEIIKEGASFRVAFCFPDTYEIGMSHLGMRILYDVMNRMDGVWCERCFAPAGDMRSLLLRTKNPLYALESGDSLAKFDVLAFTLQYELSYTNVLDMLFLAGIPLLASERDDRYPLVIAGGPCAFNPEPLCDFTDLFVIGEGEEATPELIELLSRAKRDNTPKHETLRMAASLEGVYVPSLYEVSYNPDGTIAAISPLRGAPEAIRKRTVWDLDKAPYPETPLSPSTEIVHDRVMLELFRGCIRGCRFCQAGFISRPVREKSAEVLNKQAKNAIKYSGSEEIGLVSLSTSDYTELSELCGNLVSWCEPKRVGLSLPSLRADSFSPELLESAGSVRKSGLTFAPEAGSARMRDVINKNLTEDSLMNAVTLAAGGGWSGVKLYFMIGLPTETDEDVSAIAELTGRVYQKWRQTIPDKSRACRITASASCFVPKPHTPFQWEAMDTPEELKRKAGIIKNAMRRQITFNWHEPDSSFIEGVLARGDRRLGAVLLRAHSLGCRMDGWAESFSKELWVKAFLLEGFDPEFYANRKRDLAEILPWSHISTGVSTDFLKHECNRALAAEPTQDCRAKCAACGISELCSQNGGVSVKAKCGGRQ